MVAKTIIILAAISAKRNIRMAQQISLLENNGPIVLYLFWIEYIVLGKDNSEFAFNFCIPSPEMGSHLLASCEM